MAPPPPPPPPPLGGHCLGRLTMNTGYGHPPPPPRQVRGFVGTNPIPQAVVDIVNALARCRLNQFGFPSRVDLHGIPEMRLLITGGFHVTSPLAPFVGDTRVMSTLWWSYFLLPSFDSGATLRWNYEMERQVEQHRAAMDNMRRMQNPLQPFPHGILPPPPPPPGQQQPAAIPGQLPAPQPTSAAYGTTGLVMAQRERQQATSIDRPRSINFPASQQAAPTPTAQRSASSSNLRQQASNNATTQRLAREGITPERFELFEQILNSLLYRKSGPGAPFELDKTDGKWKATKKALDEAVNSARAIRLKKGVQPFTGIETFTALVDLNARGVLAYSGDKIVFTDEE